MMSVQGPWPVASPICGSACSPWLRPTRAIPTGCRCRSRGRPRRRALQVALVPDPFGDTRAGGQRRDLQPPGAVRSGLLPSSKQGPPRLGEAARPLAPTGRGRRASVLGAGDPASSATQTALRSIEGYLRYVPAMDGDAILLECVRRPPLAHAGLVACSSRAFPVVVLPVSHELPFRDGLLDLQDQPKWSSPSMMAAQRTPRLRLFTGYGPAVRFRVPTGLAGGLLVGVQVSLPAFVRIISSRCGSRRGACPRLLQGRSIRSVGRCC